MDLDSQLYSVGEISTLFSPCPELIFTELEEPVRFNPLFTTGFTKTLLMDISFGNLLLAQ